MQNGMLGNGETLRRIFTGPIADLMMKLNGDEGVTVEEELKKFLRKEPCWVPKPAAAPRSLLKLAGTVALAGTTERFIAKKKFVVDTGRKAKVKIAFVWEDFNRWFGGKVEEPMVATTLRYHDLPKNSVDGPIIAALGGEAAAETKLVEVFSLIEKQPAGEDGDLLTNDYANLFYVRDLNGVLRAVRVLWRAGDRAWFVRACPVTDPLAWLAGLRVFSRNA